MLVKLTLAMTKKEFFIRADLILVAEYHAQHIGETVIQTSLMSQRGALSYVVTESPAAIAEAVASALREGKPAVASGIIH